jgi:hypothetical protein
MRIEKKNPISQMGGPMVFAWSLAFAGLGKRRLGEILGEYVCPIDIPHIDQSSRKFPLLPSVSKKPAYACRAPGRSHSGNIFEEEEGISKKV